MSFGTRIFCIIIGIFNFGNYQVVANIRGIPGIDYPSYSSIPRTSFKCSDQEHATGFYADLETRCQVFHYCYENRKETFLCPIGTTFNQAINSCDYWYSSECDSTEVLLAPTEERNNVFNDQPLVPVTSPPYNVFEKMIELRDSSGSLYKQNGLSVIQPGDSHESFPENNRKSYENSLHFNVLPSSLRNLEEIPQTVERDLNFVPYDHDAVDVDDIEIVFSKDEQLKTMSNNPNFDYAEEEGSFSQEEFNSPEETDNFRLDADEILHRMYQNEYSSEKQVNEILNMDPNSSNKDGVSNFGLNSDSMLHKRLSEVESKKRRIRRKPKYVVLQTNFVENPESQNVDPEHETASSSKNTLMVTYALDSNIVDFNVNAADNLKIEYGKSKRNRKPLGKEYSMDAEISATDIDKEHGYSENSEYQSDQTKAFDEVEVSPDVVKQISDSNSEDLYEFEHANNINTDKENDNIEVHMGNLKSFTPNEENLENQQLDFDEQMEVDESLLESDTMVSDEINKLITDNSENSYQLHELSDSVENDFIQEYTEESLGISKPFSDSENGATSIEIFDSNEVSDSYTSTREITESETLNSLGHNIIVNDSFEENQNDQIYLEFDKEESSLKDMPNNENNVYIESVDDTDLNENQRFEDSNLEFERDGKSGVRVNSKYLSFDKIDVESSRLHETVESYDEDRISSTDGQEKNFFKDTHIESEINVDSLEYFESEGQGYFMDEYGRIYIISGENGESETLIYVGDIDPEGNLRTDTLDTYLPQAESFPEAMVPTREDSHFPTETQDPVKNFNPIDSMENEFGKEVVEYQDINELAEHDLKSVLGEEDDQPQAENSIPQGKDSDYADFPGTEISIEHNSMIGIQIMEETDVAQSNLNQMNATDDNLAVTSVQFLEDEHLEPESVKSPEIEEKEINVIEIPEAKKEEMAQDLDKPKDSKFLLSSIPLPANDYEKGLYDEKVKHSHQDPNTVNSNAFPATFYKELQEVPVINRINPEDSKKVGRDAQTAELLNIKNRLFRNIKSDLASDEVKSAAAEVDFPSKVIDNLFSSFSSPFQSVQGNVPRYFPLHSPKFRSAPGFTTSRTGKTFKPAKIFKLINFGKKLLKLKRAKLNNLKEYFNS